MKISSRKLGIIIVAAVVVFAGIAFLVIKNNSSKPSVAETATPVETASPEPSTLGVSTADREQVRSDFINDCTKVVGQSRVTDCTCTADYLATHYSDAELAKLYLQYHSSGTIPQEVKTAMSSCTSK